MDVLQSNYSSQESEGEDNNNLFSVSDLVTAVMENGSSVLGTLQEPVVDQCHTESRSVNLGGTKAQVQDDLSSGISNTDREDTDLDVNTFLEISINKRVRKRKPEKDTWRRILNKNKRMKGETYLGYQHNICPETRKKKQSFGTLREGRTLGASCVSKYCIKRKNLHCAEFPESIRQELFDKFWKCMDWGQKKSYVASLVDRVPVKRKSPGSLERREDTFNYFLKFFDNKLQVCRQMFLSTLGLRKFEVLSWIKKSQFGVPVIPQTNQRTGRPRSVVAVSAKEFIDMLPKLPSHYARFNTSKVYLQPDIQSKSRLYQSYTKYCEDKDLKPCSTYTFSNLFEEMNISFFIPRKDQCDMCVAFRQGNVIQKDWELHCNNKDLARDAKEADKINAVQGQCHVLTMDMQAVLLSPVLNASSLYYKTKLMVHNFTVYDLRTHTAVCYVWNESEGDLKSSTIASCLVDFISTYLTDTMPVIIYSDGCTSQNRNSMMANALLDLAISQGRIITQKFLERGHTQMECDSVHSVIGAALKRKEIYLPSDYVKIIENARRKQPYIVKELSYEFFIDYSKEQFQRYTSIRPGRKKGDACVTDIKNIMYAPDGKISYKLGFGNEDWKPLPQVSKTVNNTTFPKMFQQRLKISDRKYKDLQDLKHVLPVESHQFYDDLPH